MTCTGRRQRSQSALRVQQPPPQGILQSSSQLRSVLQGEFGARWWTPGWATLQVCGAAVVSLCVQLALHHGCHVGCSVQDCDGLMKPLADASSRCRNKQRSATSSHVHAMTKGPLHGHSSSTAERCSGRSKHSGFGVIHTRSGTLKEALQSACSITSHDKQLSSSGASEGANASQCSSASAHYEYVTHSQHRHLILEVLIAMSPQSRASGVVGMPPAPTGGETEPRRSAWASRRYVSAMPARPT